MSKFLIVDLNISPEQYQRHYQGAVRQVICTARDGRKVQFPSAILQRFVSHTGIHGSFRLLIDDNNKLISVDRL
jgi:hypothetical protein